MSELKRCDTCKGRKVLMGLGCIEKKCQTCSGLGWVDHVEEPIEFLKEKKEKPKSKSGRPKAVKHEDAIAALSG